MLYKCCNALDKRCNALDKHDNMLYNSCNTRYKSDNLIYKGDNVICEVCPESNARVVWIQKVFIIIQNKIYIVLSSVYTCTNNLEASGFNSKVNLY